MLREASLALIDGIGYSLIAFCGVITVIAAGLAAYIAFALAFWELPQAYRESIQEYGIHP